MVLNKVRTIKNPPRTIRNHQKPLETEIPRIKIILLMDVAQ